MSGGSLDYLYRRVNEVAAELRSRSHCAVHSAFATHLDKVAKALHDLEWVWSADYAVGDELDAMRAVISTEDEIGAAVARAEQAVSDLKEALARVGK